MPIQMNEKHDRIIEPQDLECLYQDLNLRLGRPALDIDVCREADISLDEFHRLLDRFHGLNLGNFERIASTHKNPDDDPPIRYIPDAARAEASIVRLQSEFRELLANAIDELPQLERLIASLHYYDELTLGEIEKVLGISESAIAQFQTKTILRLRSILRREALLAPSDKLQANLSTCSAGD